MMLLRALQRRKPPIRRLILTDNLIGAATISECAGPVLTGGLALETLDLSWNCLPPGAGAELADALAWNRSLASLALAHNNVGSAGAAFADALQHNGTLTALDLAANSV
ncbi:unnamed protein product, partial [Phaeothamnion confervicola]